DCHTTSTEAARCAGRHWLSVQRPRGESCWMVEIFTSGREPSTVPAPGQRHVAARSQHARVRLFSLTGACDGASVHATGDFDVGDVCPVSVRIVSRKVDLRVQPGAVRTRLTSRGRPPTYLP